MSVKTEVFNEETKSGIVMFNYELYKQIRVCLQHRQPMIILVVVSLYIFIY